MESGGGCSILTMNHDGDYIKMFMDVKWQLVGYIPEHPGSWTNPEFSGESPGSERI